MIQAVIFDLDGTLIHLPIDYDGLFREFCRIMKTKNVRPLNKTIPALDKQTKCKVFAVWNRFELEAFKDMTLSEEGIALYKKFLSKPKILVTMQGDKIVQNITKSLDLPFDHIITRESSLDRIEQLETAIKKLGKTAESVLFVGNTDEDSSSAKHVGCQFLRVGE